MAFESCGGKWWKVFEKMGRENVWRRVVEHIGGREWQRRLVERNVGGKLWRLVVEEWVQESGGGELWRSGLKFVGKKSGGEAERLKKVVEAGETEWRRRLVKESGAEEGRWKVWEKRV